MKFPAFEPINLKNDSLSFDTIDLPIEKIESNERQPRNIFNEASLEELASSIIRHGIIQPIIVRNIDSGKKYQIVAGERRWRAAKIAGLETIPAIIKEYDHINRIAISLIENIQRENLNPLEEAQAIQSLLEECQLTHQQVAESIGKSRATVSNLLRLLTIAPQVKTMINSGLLEMGHARALLSLTREQQVEIAEEIVAKSLSVRETEKFVQKINNSLQKQNVFITLELEKYTIDCRNRLSKLLLSKVNVYFSPVGKGRITIHFDSVEEANWLMNNLTINENQKS